MANSLRLVKIGLGSDWSNYVGLVRTVVGWCFRPLASGTAETEFHIADPWWIVVYALRARAGILLLITNEFSIKV